MSKTIIQVENLSKAYQLGQFGTGTISRDIERFWTTKIRGKEDPFLRIGETNDRSVKGESDIVWSLRDINFEINEGEAVGIIGKNGAGKSTLLKLLSRVTGPTSGEIKIKGRIASLLEVGTGFHPELSGRENIYLNGAILGMRKKEITRKLEEIIDFSGVERYVDTPVKRYSSGMYVRLAFAVAAHLESEILIVDEVLAVGDAEFQKKCLGKMGDISKGEGRTVLFVSHNMAAVKSLCTKGIVLDKGEMVHYSTTDDAISFYSSNSLKDFESPSIHKAFSDKVSIAHTEVRNNGIQIGKGAALYLGDKLEIIVTLDIRENITDLAVAMDVLNTNSELIAHLTNEDDAAYFGKVLKGQQLTITIVTEALLFIPGSFMINLWIGAGHIESLYSIKNFFNFHLEQSNFTKRTRPLPQHSRLYLPSFWNIQTR